MASVDRQSWIPANLTLRGQHAVLEPMCLEHSDALGEAAPDGELWNLRFTNVPTKDKIHSMVKKALTNRNAKIELPFVVRRLSDEKIIGSTRYYLLAPEHRNLSIGYTWYSKSAHRTAINTECKLMLLRYAFEDLRCISVSWHTDNLNINSQKAIERLGATFEGVLRNNRIMPDGRYRHTHCYSMLDTEWPVSKQFLEQRLTEIN